MPPAGLLQRGEEKSFFLGILSIGSWRPSLRIRLSDFLGLVTLLLGPCAGDFKGRSPLGRISEMGISQQLGVALAIFCATHEADYVAVYAMRCLLRGPVDKRTD